MKEFERAAELAGNLGQNFHLALDAMSSEVAFFFFLLTQNFLFHLFPVEALLSITMT